MTLLAVGDTIQVLVDFRPANHPSKPVHATPRAFIWKNRRYLIKSLHLVHKEKEGDAVLYYFSVSTETNMYKLSFNNLTLEWRLVEVWSE